MQRARDLLEDADDFLGSANDLLRTGRWSKVCFHSQQCAELALKAALNVHGIEARGHSLTDLLNELQTFERTSYLRDHCRILDQFYIPTRYANAFHSGSASRHYTEAQAREALQFATEILKKMREIVEGVAKQG